MIREVVILAAGEGKRMKNTTDAVLLNTPKPLLEINGKSLIGMKIERLIGAGFDVTVVVNAKDKAIFMKNLSNYKINYVVQGQDKGTAAGLFAAKNRIKDGLFLVMMGDDIFHIDLEDVKKAEEPTVFIYQAEDVSKFGLVLTNDKGYVTEILEKKGTGGGWVNSGIYIMPKQFFDIYNEIKPEEKSGEKYLTEALNVLREKNIIFKAKKLSFWFGVNTPEQLKRAEVILKNERKG